MTIMHGKVVSHLALGQCRVEQAVYFADDRVVLLIGNPNAGFRPGLKTTIDALVQDDIDGWIGCEEVDSIDDGEVAISRGIGDWEGEGFLLLRESSSKSLRWILHFSSSEEFRSIRREGEWIVADSGNYPTSWAWRISMNTPWIIEVAGESS